MDNKNEWIKKVRLFLDADLTRNLYYQANSTEDLETLSIILKRAKKMYSQSISECDQLINFN